MIFRSAFAAVALLAGPAAAVSYSVAVTGVVADTQVNSFTFGGVDFTSGRLELTGFTPFTLVEGDTVDFSVMLDASFVVPKSFATPGYAQFIGFNLEGFTAPAEPAGASGIITFTGLTGDLMNPAPGGCGNCLSIIAGRSFGEAFGFTGLSGTVSVDTLFEPYEITSISISYQINPTAAVPEPAMWALLLGGFGAVGGTMRARRRVQRVAA